MHLTISFSVRDENKSCCPDERIRAGDRVRRALSGILLVVALDAPADVQVAGGRIVDIDKKEAVVSRPGAQRVLVVSR